MKIYTDGSVKGKKAGWAYVVTNSGEASTTDSYKAELMAVVMAFENARAPFSLVTDHEGIRKSLKHMMRFPDDPLPKHYPELWQRIHDRIDLMEDVKWMRRCSNQEMRIADQHAKDAWR